MSLASGQERKILITVRAYPQPSGTYQETSCVAGVDLDNEAPIRLYPIRARELADNNRFKKYSIIAARVAKATSDARPESHNINVDSIRVLGRVETKGTWHERNQHVDCFRVSPSVEDLRKRFTDSGSTATTPSLALIRPREITGFTMIHKGRTEWTPQELAKLNNHGQLDMFESLKNQSNQHGYRRQQLQFIPYKFRYQFLCDDSSCQQPHDFEVLDWEITEAYRTWRTKYGEEGWEIAMLNKFNDELPAKDLQFFLGTIKNHPNTWTIIGLYYPLNPKGG